MTSGAKIGLSNHFQIVAQKKFRLCVIITFGFYELLLSEIGHCVTQVEIEKGSLKGVSPISLIKSLTECCIKFSTYSGLKPLYIF